MSTYQINQDTTFHAIFNSTGWETVWSGNLQIISAPAWIGMAELKTLSNKLLTGQAIRVAVLVTSSVATSFIIPSAPFSLAITGGIFITVNYDYQLVAVAQ